MHIRYHQEEETGVWTSVDVFEIEHLSGVIRGIVAGWLWGRARWATLASDSGPGEDARVAGLAAGTFLYGIDRKGGRHTTLTSLQAALKGALR